MATPTTVRRSRGFTLIELLIVIGIIGVLAAVLLPSLFEAGQTTKVRMTEANMKVLMSNADRFTDTSFGFVPPDDFKSPDEKRIKPTWKSDNGRNTGIESLVCFLCQPGAGCDISGLAENFTNTDGDEQGVELPRILRKDRIEIADLFGTPLAYFGKFGMGKEQQVTLFDGSVVAVKAKKRPDGHYHGEGRFQLLSAGPDLQFGTADDIVVPDN